MWKSLSTYLFLFFLSITGISLEWIDQSPWNFEKLIILRILVKFEKKNRANRNCAIELWILVSKVECDLDIAMQKRNFSLIVFTLSMTNQIGSVYSTLVSPPLWMYMVEFVRCVHAKWTSWTKSDGFLVVVFFTWIVTYF